MILLGYRPLNGCVRLRQGLEDSGFCSLLPLFIGVLGFLHGLRVRVAVLGLGFRGLRVEGCVVRTSQK